MEDRVNPENYDKDSLTESEKTALCYLKDLGLNWEKLRGKRVLDLGAGKGEFAQEAKKRGIEVISVDYIPGGMGEDGILPEGVSYLIADMKKLPFQNESFDLVVARAAITVPPTKDEVREAINEGKRVLKTGGEFRFGPGPISLSVEVFDTSELFSPEENEKWSMPDHSFERRERIGQKTMEFIQSIDPEFRLEKGNEKREFGYDSYYILKKQ